MGADSSEKSGKLLDSFGFTEREQATKGEIERCAESPDPERRKRVRRGSGSTWVFIRAPVDQPERTHKRREEAGEKLSE